MKLKEHKVHTVQKSRHWCMEKGNQGAVCNFDDTVEQ